MKGFIAAINIYSVIFLFVASLVGISALFSPGLYTAHDIWHQVARLYHYHNSITEGSILPTSSLLLANHYGYPLFTFSYHLPWLIGTVLLSIGLSLLTTIKVLFALSFVFSAFLMYIFGKLTFKKELSATFAAFLYIWAPHRFSTIFVSAAMGRAYIYVAIPLILIGYALIQKNRKEGIIITSVGIMCGILSHFISFIVVSPLLIVLYIFADNKRKLFFASLLGLGLSAFYLIPAMVYSKITQVSLLSQLYESNFLDLKQLIYSKWGYGLPQKFAREGAISYQLGIVQWIVVTITALLVFLKKLANKIVALFLIFLFSIFMMTEQSQLVWKFVSSIVVIDYPATYLILAVTTVSLLAGYTLDKIRFTWIVILLVPIVFYTNRNHLKVNEVVPNINQAQIDAEITTNSYNEYLPKTANSKLLERDDLFTLPSTVKTNDISSTENITSLIIINPQQQLVTFHQFAFPEVGLYIDNKETSYEVDTNGRISADISEGEHKIEIRIQKTPLEKLSIILTLLSFLVLCRMLLRYVNDKKLLKYPKPS